MKNKPITLTTDERKREWDEIEETVMNYQTEEHREYYAESLLNKFSPLFKKYITLLKYGQIDFNDLEMKQFICLFVDDYELKKALNRKKISVEHKNDIYKKFNFILETYGHVSEEDILSDLYMCFLTMANRYKQTGKNFCAYLYNSYRYEVARHVKNHIKNPLCVHYKNFKYEDCVNGDVDVHIDLAYEDNYYELATGLPDFSWINGSSCDAFFSILSTLQRTILVKYYLEDWNDRQISEITGVHINTINQKRRDALDKLCKANGITRKDLKRNRKSGKKASSTISSI